MSLAEMVVTFRGDTSPLDSAVANAKAQLQELEATATGLNSAFSNIGQSSLTGMETSLKNLKEEVESLKTSAQSMGTTMKTAANEMTEGTKKATQAIKDMDKEQSRVGNRNNGSGNFLSSLFFGMGGAGRMKGGLFESLLGTVGTATRPGGVAAGGEAIAAGASSLFGMAGKAVTGIGLKGLGAAIGGLAGSEVPILGNAIGVAVGFLLADAAQKIMEKIPVLGDALMAIPNAIASTVDKIIEEGAASQEKMFQATIAFGDQGAAWAQDQAKAMSKDSMFTSGAYLGAMTTAENQLGDMNLSEDQKAQYAKMIGQYATLTPGKNLEQAGNVVDMAIMGGGRGQTLQLKKYSGIDITPATMKEMYGDKWKDMDSEQQRKARYDVFVASQATLAKAEENYMKTYNGQMALRKTLQGELLDSFKGYVEYATPFLKLENGALTLRNQLMDEFGGKLKGVTDYFNKKMGVGQWIDNFVGKADETDPTKSTGLYKVRDLRDLRNKRESMAASGQNTKDIDKQISTMEGSLTTGEKFVLKFADTFSKAFEKAAGAVYYLLAALDAFKTAFAPVINWAKKEIMGFAQGMADMALNGLTALMTIAKGLYLLVNIWSSGQNDIIGKTGDTMALLYIAYTKGMNGLGNIMIAFAKQVYLLMDDVGRGITNAITDAVNDVMKGMGSRLQSSIDNEKNPAVKALYQSTGLTGIANTFSNFTIGKESDADYAKRRANDGAMFDAMTIMNNMHWEEKRQSMLGGDWAQKYSIDALAKKYNVDLSGFDDLLAALKAIKIKSEQTPNNKDTNTLADAISGLADTVDGKKMDTNITIHVNQTFKGSVDKATLDAAGQEVTDAINNTLAKHGIGTS